MSRLRSLRADASLSGTAGKDSLVRPMRLRTLKKQLVSAGHHPESGRLLELKGMVEDWLDDWKETLRFQSVGSDLAAGITVAAVALPLNLALAVSAGLPPSAGLLAGAIGGAIAALFGGSRLQVTGPAAALNLMVFLIAKEHGAAGVAATALVVAGIQILLALLLAGKLVHFISEAVLGGFLTGVGLKLLDGQIPELFGVDYKITEMVAMTYRPLWLHQVSWLAVVCGLGVAFLMTSTRQIKRFPGALMGVLLVTAISVYLKWDLKRVGEVTALLPSPAFPGLGSEEWGKVLIQAIPLGLLAAVESLLSAQAMDRMTGAKKAHNSNLELLGQGLANLGSGLMGTMPVTGVVVRSSVNYQSGGKTRLSALIHGAILLFSTLYLSEHIAKIPLAALAGLLCVVGLRLVEVKTFIHLLRHEKLAALSFTAAMAGTVSGHLITGLGIGLALSGIEHWMTRTKRHEAAKKVEQSNTGIRAVVSSVDPAPSLPETYGGTPGGLNWLNQIRERGKAAVTAFVHPQASVIGRVVLGENVHIAAGSSVRADEGSPFFIGANTNIQDGVVIHALKEKWVTIRGEKWAVYVGKNVSMAHQALVHGPSYIGDNTFIGFKSIVHDSVVGSHCFVGHGAIVVGVDLPDGRFVPPGSIIDSQEKANELPRVSEQHLHFNEDVVDVNKGLAEAYRKQEEASSCPRPAVQPAFLRTAQSLASRF